MLITAYTHTILARRIGRRRQGPTDGDDDEADEQGLSTLGRQRVPASAFVHSPVPIPAVTAAAQGCCPRVHGPRFVAARRVDGKKQ